MVRNSVSAQEQILQGNRRAIAKAITLLESTRPESFEQGQEFAAFCAEGGMQPQLAGVSSEKTAIENQSKDWE